ncbi:SepM family pheromone-processing serine protease [Neobacillus sp. CF12]|uniref:SepM family pheromone-processing serine protease n=1 Tax=Neobacillus sp. CF12 TaxID=3055864 RepID=UPI0025A1B42C|nr:SepM family pheromone-processing serine protease [Neobacillus sp. CF12]MDM5328056.1 SepM family pheromone-processing serine protease [Neobacillus sp. CF12]
MRRKIFIGSSIVISVLMIAGIFFSLPYYVSKPGIAKELSPIIQVEDGNEGKGSFMLTTVRMGRANIYSYVEAKLFDYVELYPVEAILHETETQDEYNARQLHAMAGSKLNAIEVAYKKAGYPVEYQYKGVYVVQVVPDMPAEGKLRAGDRIIMVDGQKFDSSENFIEYVGKKKADEQIELTLKRNGKTKTVLVTVKPFKDDPKKIGIGISLVDDKDISVNPNVTVKTDEIGGPSAGLMFALEIYDQLMEEDFTKGYQVAGTGTIDSKGAVGPIGGIDQKIVAADKAGAEIFFAPNEKGSSDSNYKLAVKTAKEIDSKIKIVPVDLIDDAINYLQNLPMK